jgi:hypothetical protein
VLPAAEREAYERQANGAKERYYAALADYKKTPQYDAYQKYLEDFKAKHAVPTKGQSTPHCPSISNTLTRTEGKRSKLEMETSNSTRSGSHDLIERAANRRLSSVQPDLFSKNHQQSGDSPPIGPSRLPSGPSFSSKPTSPASYTSSALNSPRIEDHYPPISASPRNGAFDASPINASNESRVLPDANYPFPIAAYPPPSHQLASGVTPSHPFMPSFHNAMDFVSRRPVRENTRLPPLTHEDTTLSSESGHSASIYHGPPLGRIGTLLPGDPAKTFRTLPQPVPHIGPSTSPLDRPSNALLSQLPPHQLDYRTQGPLAALVRAGELASRIADDEDMDTQEIS